MKKLAIFFTAVVLMSSCNNAQKTDATEPGGAVTTDPKDENMELERAKRETLDSVNLANIRQRTIDSMNLAAAEKATETHGSTHHVVHHAAGTPAVNHSPATTANPQTQSAPTTANPQVATSSPAATATTAATPEKKKGLNNAVKGALIGLGTGAAAGAIIDKDHRGQGAIIGGVIGAGGGAIGGAVLDKNKKKKAKQDSIDAANGIPK